MNSHFSRRTFVKASLLAAAAAPMALRSTAAEKAPAATGKPKKPPFSPTANPAGLTVYQVGPQIWVRWNNVLVASYRAHSTQKYPYIYPLAGPVTGLPLTAETSLPYPHHRSLFFACDHINGGDYWHPTGEEIGNRQILSSGPAIEEVTADTVDIRDNCNWNTDGKPVMKDKRRILVTIAGPRLRFVDWEIEWTAVEKVQITKTNHSLFSIRAAIDIARTGGGELINADGDVGEKATAGKKSAWCDFSGKRAGVPGDVVEGIALLDHPKNPWSPCPWFTRDYGFASPTPFFWMDKPLELEAGKSLILRYRIVAHAGNAAEAAIDKIYKDWAAA